MELAKRASLITLRVAFSEDKNMGILDRLKSALSPNANRLDVKSRYELLREAVFGTMSKFYMARNRATGEVVGLKILDPKKTATFEHEIPGHEEAVRGGDRVPVRASLYR